jgi:Tfp pilus assembly protein, tip-associated adhesin PilY1
MKLALLPMVRRVRSFAGQVATGPGTRFLVLVAVATTLTWTAAPQLADARVNPLVVIERQIRKANMLIVLDTSGSMNGVPGGQFQNNAECGVDCDNGVNCRQGGLLGICQAWTTRNCLSDDDCRHGYCSKDNITICASNDNCDQDPGVCSYTGGSCTANSPCPEQMGTCTKTSALCDAQHACASVGYCKYGTNVLCTNPGSSCPSIGTCSTLGSQTCQNASTCPPVTSGGTCSQGSTPTGGCSQTSDCPLKMHCQVSGDSCGLEADQPHCVVYSGNICYGDTSHYPPTHHLDSCSKESTCHGDDHCVTPPLNQCTGTPNVCNLPSSTCNMHSDNSCTATSNTCSIPANNCNLPPANNCQLPASATDTCVSNAHGTPGPIRMCKSSQVVCSKDSDCGSSDLCGPATSRTVVAKRAISKLVMDNYPLVNFGLMTFWQDNYYPYYKVSSSGTTETINVYETENQLHKAGCYTWNRQTHIGGPSATCTISGHQMTLRSTADSRYRVRKGWSSWDRYDVDFCGDSCNMPNNLGWGDYQGSYYQYQRTTQTASSTLLVRDTYDGHDITVSGNNYTYYTPLTNYYNGGAAPPINVANCGSACSATCGGRWDAQLAPFLDTSDNADNALAAAQALTAQMAYAADGGLITYYGTPTGCTLENNVAKTPQTSAYDYMKAVKNGYTSASPSLNIPADSVTCRSNFVLLITDGAANGPGDVDSNGNNVCDDTVCAADNPVTAGCKCRTVLAAYDLKHNLGVTVFVVGFSGDVSAGAPAVANNNVAKAGGSGSAFLATNEDQLDDALQLAVYTAIQGNYSSSAGSTSAGTQQAITVVEGKYALDSRMEFPSWKGHLYAYNVAGTTPVLSWDAGTQLSNTSNWKNRRVYTWDGTNMVKIQVNSSTGAITNKDALAALGMGATANEAEAVAQWALGNPASGNPAVLGAIVNSTPIDVASPGDIALPGGHNFFLKYMNRPHLIYVGSSDMMLHAFFLEDTKVGTTTYAAGSEAFAFIPPDFLTNLRRLYAQGGQELNPYKHIFGLADSPKVKSLCVSGCTDDSTAVWKTLLVMPEGYGGNNTFMLDVTNPFGTNALNDPPVTVQWHTGVGASADTYNSVLGNTISLPAFLLNKTTSLNDYRLIFSSGYAVTDGSTTQGRTLVMASAINGTTLATPSVSSSANCAQEYAALTDVATARDFAKGQNDKLVAAYFGDTAGQLWRYTLAGGLSLAYNFTCDHPLHFSPTVVQLDRDSVASSHAHEIYLVQVTNSNLDLDTVSLPASRMIFAKELAQADSNGNITGVVKDTAWGTGGQIVLTAGTNQICGVTHLATDGSVVCDTQMPVTARPTSTPLGILKADGNGFEVVTMWYAAPSSVCDVGKTYLTIHQMTSNAVTQRLGYMVTSTNPATSPVIIGGRVYVFGGTTTFDDVTPFLPDAISAGSAVQASPYSGQFSRFNWTEVLE